MKTRTLERIVGICILLAGLLFAIGIYKANASEGDLVSRFYPSEIIASNDDTTKSGEALEIQIRQEKMHQEDRVFASLSGLTSICKGKEAKAQIKMYGIISIQAAFSLQNDFFILKNNTGIRDIDLYIASPGGGTFGGFAIVEVIKTAKAEGFKITAYGIALVGSMAIPIYAACEERIAYRSTIFMVHPSALQSGQTMTGADLQSQTEFHVMSEDRYVSVLAEFTKLSKAEWLKKIEKDTWFSAEQAKEWGLVDVIH